VAERHGIAPFDILKQDLCSFLVDIRQEAYYLAFLNIPDLSLCEIARRFRRDHTTVMRGIASYCVKHGLEVPHGKVWKLVDELRARPPKPRSQTVRAIEHKVKKRPNLAKVIAPLRSPRKSKPSDLLLRLLREFGHAYAPSTALCGGASICVDGPAITHLTFAEQGGA
jgi:hypothetical protein